MTLIEIILRKRIRVEFSLYKDKISIIILAPDCRLTQNTDIANKVDQFSIIIIFMLFQISTYLHAELLRLQVKTPLLLSIL